MGGCHGNAFDFQRTSSILKGDKAEAAPVSRHFICSSIASVTRNSNPQRSTYVESWCIAVV